MGMNAIYRGPARLPPVIPVFPLPGALLLPRGQMPLNIFEPRYLAMVDDALKGDRIIGMIQPDADNGGSASVPRLYHVGCAGRITQFAETGDGRYLVTLIGIARFRIEEELGTTTPYRQCRVDFEPFAADFTRACGRGRGRPGGCREGPARLRAGGRRAGRLARHRGGAERGAGQRALHDEPLRRAREAGAARGAKS